MARTFKLKWAVILQPKIRQSHVTTYAKSTTASCFETREAAIFAAEEMCELDGNYYYLAEIINMVQAGPARWTKTRENPPLVSCPKCKSGKIMIDKDCDAWCRECSHEWNTG